MPRNFTFCIWVLLFVLLSIPFSLLAQDTTNTPAVIESPTIEFNATVETTTIEAPTLEVTQVIVPSETATAYDGQIAESTEAVLPTTEVTAEATSEQTEAVQPAVTSTVTEVAPLFPEPALTPILSEAFHSQDISRWNVGAGWGLVPQQPGFALQVTNTNTTVSSNVAVYDNVAVEMLVQSETGTFNLYLRQNGTENYRLSLYPDGRVDLYHTSTLLSTTTVAPAARNQWRHVRFSAMNDTVRAAIDNVEVIALRDATPLLTAGQIAFNATFLAQPGNSGQQRNRLLVDNIRFWIPANQVNQPTEIAATPIPDEWFTVTVPPEAIPNQFIISFASESSQQERQAYLGQLGGRKLRDIPQLRAAIVELPAQAVEHRFRHSQALRSIQPNYRVTVLSNDPLYSQQWGLDVMNAPEAWLALPVGTPTVTVAVVDSGICAAHPDLQGRILAGWDFVENDATPQDDLGHGCSVAGIIAANADNNLGIAGAAPNAQIMPLRVLNSAGMGTYADVAAAIIYAADNGATVINLSLGGSFPATVLEDAVNYAAVHGVTMVAAAGNTGGAVLYPAKYAPVIAVASIDPNLQMSSFSSRGSEIDLLAPGSGIVTTTKDGGYASLSGTSFAAPHVAAAIVLQMGLGSNLALNGGIVSVNLTGTTVTPTPALTATPTPTVEVPPQLAGEFINPVPNIVVRHIEDFDNSVIDSTFWTANGNYAFVPYVDGQALQLGGGELPLVYAGGDIDNFALSVDVWMETETFQIEFRSSPEGAYRATFAPTGEVQLYRGTELLQTANITAVTTGAWYTVQVAAFWDGLHLNINSQDIFGFGHDKAFVPGPIVVGSGRSLNSQLLIDNLVWRIQPPQIVNNAPILSQQAISALDFTIFVNANNGAELAQRINQANLDCPASTSINLTGTDYKFTSPYGALNGATALPVVSCVIKIEGSGQTIERDPNASSQFRIFGVTGLNSFLIVNNVTVRGGYVSSWNGGGIYVTGGGGFAISSGTITTNTSVNGDGGGIYYFNNAAAQSILINHSTISSNYAVNGGAISYFHNLAPNILPLYHRVVQSNITQNVASERGGGLYVGQAPGVYFVIEGSIFANNRGNTASTIPPWDVGSAIFYPNGAGSIAVNDSCVTGNTDTAMTIFGSGFNFTDNWWGAPAPTVYNQPDTNGDVVFFDGAVSYSPPKSTAPVLHGQLCDTNPAQFNVIAVDAPIGGQALSQQSVGVQGIDPDLINNGYCSITEGIYKANYLSSHANDQIPPDPQVEPFSDCAPIETDEDENYPQGAFIVNVPGVLHYFTAPGQLDPITGNVVIRSLSAPAEIERWNQVNIPDFRLFEITNTGQLTLENIIVRNGRAVDNGITNSGNGGGILNAGSLTLINSAVIGNHATGQGGGIYNASTGRLEMINTAVQHNTSIGLGGGLYNEGTLIPSVTSTGGCFVGNSGIGVYTIPSIELPHYWWGAADGPSVNNAGSGETLAANVGYSPFLEVPPPLLCDPLLIAVEQVLPRADGSVQSPPIPYIDEVVLNVVITNTLDVPVTSWELKIFGILARGELPGYSNVTPLRLGNNNDGAHSPNERRLIWSSNNTLNVGQTIVKHPVVSARMSGNVITTYELRFTTSDNQQIVKTGVIYVMNAGLTAIDFEEEHSFLKTMMFWAVFNESSEGRFFEFNPDSVNLDCYLPGWPVTLVNGTPANIFHSVIEAEETSIECRSHHYLDIQAMINGVLNAERNPSTGINSLFSYFTDNFEGSLGNNPPPGKGYEPISASDPLAAEAGKSILFLTPSCWLNNESYRLVLASNDQERIGNWHNHYLVCMHDIWYQQSLEADPGRVERATHILEFYDHIFGDEISIINQAIDDFQQNCNGDNAASLACDPTLGAIERKFATNPTSIIDEIEACTGANVAAALLASDTLPSFQSLMSQLGAPQFGGTPGSYTPKESSILYPVVEVVYDFNNDSSISNCIWHSVVYQRAFVDESAQSGAAFHYPR